MQFKEAPDPVFVEIWQQCQRFTMTSEERGLALYRAILHLAENNIQGDIVECGVWRGGSAMIAIKTLQHCNLERNIYLFDTFEGMTAPSVVDVDFLGQSAADQLRDAENDKSSSHIWAYAKLDEVKSSIVATGYPENLVHYIVGDVSQTLPLAVLSKIALLRLDTDFYESTLVELRHLYPLLVRHGILIIDDYGHWHGCRRAVDEYFGAMRKSGLQTPFLSVIDYTGRVANKTAEGPLAIEKYDYYPPGLDHARLLHTVPTLKERDASLINWPYMRANSPHIWRSDERAVRLPDTGILSVEEAELLFGNARLMFGRRGLEIGCHFGWSTAHMLKAGLILDIVDPALHHDDQRSAVEFSLALAAPNAQYKFWPAYSPIVLPSIHAASEQDWSFVFIDGYHEGDAPLRDTIAVAKLCADTACIMFHDLTSPHVAAGLDHLRSLGWHTGIYNTMQIMGIAWRGDIEPIRHIQDPMMLEIDQPHLQGYIVLSTIAEK